MKFYLIEYKPKYYDLKRPYVSTIYIKVKSNTETEALEMCSNLLIEPEKCWIECLGEVKDCKSQKKIFEND